MVVWFLLSPYYGSYKESREQYFNICFFTQFRLTSSFYLHHFPKLHNIRKKILYNCLTWHSYVQETKIININKINMMDDTTKNNMSVDRVRKFHSFSRVKCFFFGFYWLLKRNHTWCCSFIYNKKIPENIFIKCSILASFIYIKRVSIKFKNELLNQDVIKFFFSANHNKKKFYACFDCDEKENESQFIIDSDERFTKIGFLVKTLILLHRYFQIITIYNYLFDFFSKRMPLPFGHPWSM